MAELEESDLDPKDMFHPDNIPAATLITLLRIYDVLMVQLSKERPKEFELLEKTHGAGDVLGDMPCWNPTGEE